MHSSNEAMEVSNGHPIPLSINTEGITFLADNLSLPRTIHLDESSSVVEKIRQDDDGDSKSGLDNQERPRMSSPRIFSDSEKYVRRIFVRRLRIEFQTP